MTATDLADVPKRPWRRLFNPAVGRETEPPPWARRAATVGFFAVAVLFTAYLLQYYATGAGGPTMLAVALVPTAYVVATFDDVRRGQLYPGLPPTVSAIVGFTLIAIAVAAGLYLYTEFEAIRFSRLGRWTTADLTAGATLIGLLLEYSRRKYLPLFVLNILLAGYVVYGYVVPGLFNHPGLPWRRVVSSMSLETTTGIFEQLPQVALTLIGSFVLVLAAMRSFGVIDSILKGASRLATRSPHLLPQAAVVGSFGVAAVSSSGAANAATTGSATIPALIDNGFTRVRAAAVETATSLGGQLMPPLMGIAAFLMADYMRVSYFDVVARGFAPALIYFAGVSFAVYLLSKRFMAPRAPLETSPLGLVDKANLLAYVLSIGGLVYLMGVVRTPAMQAAQQVFVVLAVVLSVVFFARALRTKDGRRPAALLRPYVGFVETFTRMTAELAVLLAILGLVTASFTVTGVPTKVGILMVEVAGGNVALMALMAFAFGYVVGMGLPPAPTYIIVAVVLAPFMISAGVDPWVVHFFAFLIAVFGELSPPTSLTAAVAARIADASFTRTMFLAIQLCLPLLVLMVAVFTWPALIVEPGVAQLLPAAMTLVVCVGLVVSLHGRFSDATGVNVAARLLLAAAAIALLFQPHLTIAAALAVAVVAASGFGTRRARHVEAA
ncbi:MAG: TRAP transporter permease [Stackebrandtia sp.]